jgi:hypothetical protein
MMAKGGCVDMNRSKLLVVFAVAGSLLCSSGCVWLVAGAVVGAGAGGYAFSKGATEVVYPFPYEQTYSATVAALDSLDLFKENADKDAFGAKIRASRADGSPVKIDLKPLTADSTSVRIRVGAFGNRSMSEAVADAIDARLR